MTRERVAVCVARLGVLGLALSLAACAPPRDRPLVRIGSKSFTESVVLGEIAAALLREAGFAVEHHRELGGTRILWNALRRGELDVYPEYSGTLEQEIFAASSVRGLDALRGALGAQGILLGASLGFDNSYALGMKQALAERLRIRTISELREHPSLRFGFTNEFMQRADGWPSLRARYALPQTDVRGLDHDLAYRALEAGTLDVSDLYSTDVDIAYYQLRVLQDDLQHFPEYAALLLWRADLEARAPGTTSALARLEGAIDAATMIRLNARVKVEREDEALVATDFAAARLGIDARAPREGRADRIARAALDHLGLVAASLAAAIAVALPLGVLAAKRPRAGAIVLAFVGVLQTIPTLALLVFMIPLLGIGAPPAVAALFLYGLLPIVRNVHAGLHDIPSALRESAEALGLPPAQRLWWIELPLASRSILAGIKTSAVINVGTATLGALIGAGGFGQAILTGIRLDDLGLILEGALPAALLALAVQGAFDLGERWIVPAGLRHERRP